MKTARLYSFKKTEKLLVFFIFLFGIILGSGSYLEQALAEGGGDVAQKPEHWWLEVGSDIGYQKTNSWYTTQQDFLISILAARGGYRFYVKEVSFFNLYIDPYFKAELLGDLGSKDQNKFFWNNNLKYGPGLRVRAEYDEEKDRKKREKGLNKQKLKEYKWEREHGVQINYVNLDYYIEYLGISFIDRGQNIPNTIPRNNFRTGFNSWMSIDTNHKLGSSGLRGGAWFEMLGDLTYHSTNFYQDGFDKFCILTLSPKVGLRVAYKGIALEPYFRLDYVRDFLDKDWNKEAWSNNTKYGPGVRLSLGGLTKQNKTSIYLYVESVNIDYDSRVGWKSAGLSRDDVRAGITFWIPFGASKAYGSIR